MTPFAVLLLAAVQFVSGAPPTVPQSNLIYTYSTSNDQALPPLPPGFVRTLSFTFSPDEQWVAILVGARATSPHKPGVPIGSTLLLVPVPASASQTVRIDPGMPLRGTPLWSPDSQAVAVQGMPLTEAGALLEAGVPKVYNLQGRQLWTRPAAGAILGFLAPGRLLAYRLTKKGNLAGFDTVDIAADAVIPWIAEPHGRLAALDAAHHRVAVFADTGESRTVILDYPSGRILQSLKNHTVTLSNDGGNYGGGYPFQYFAENGRTLCTSETVGTFQTHPQCTDIDSGEPVAEFRRFQGGAPAAASTGGSRMVLSDLTWLPDRSGAYSFRGRVVWDFRTNSEVAAWGPPAPHVAWLGIPASITPIMPVAISATGAYVAESFGSGLRVYRIP